MPCEIGLLNDRRIITVLVLFEPFSILQDCNILSGGSLLVLIVSKALDFVITAGLTELIGNIEADRKTLKIRLLSIIGNLNVLVVKAAEM